MPPIKKSKSRKTKREKKSAVKKEVADDLSGKPAMPEEFLIVGIGASAGGVQALKEFFENVPADSGMAYVVILHLSPDHDSRLASVLQTVAAIPVTQVTKKVKVAPNRVYVVPPNEHLEMLDGHITVSPNISVEARRAPVDIFFRTLAESHHARAVAVVLSGTGANGSMGIKRIKERGGAAFVQNPREAEFSEMPRNSIATDLIDQILNVAEIPQKIVAYKKSLGTIEIPVEAEQRPEEAQQALREIFTHLRVRTGHDFSNYKRPTILRRIERRINVFNLPDIEAYARLVRENKDEPVALLKDLLISVTNFFRDKNAFLFLETDVLPKIFYGKTPEDQVRIWICGCATGEEAYSLAMLCCERTLGSIDAPQVQIFATDIDEQAIAHAREGLYTLNDAADVSPERLRRFFTKEGDGYRVRRELREMILFANHNVMREPPFSHLDLLTCRNMLIYLNQTAQERVMETFHFALNPGGFLFVGNSESVDGASDLYAAVSKEHHVFQSRAFSGHIAYPVPESNSARFRSKEFEFPRVAKYAPEPPVEAITVAGDGDGQSAALQRQSYGDLHQQMLELYAPPSIVVNAEYDILHLSERAGRFLQIAGGEPTKNLLKLIRPELRLELRAALYQAVQNQTNVEVRNLKFSQDGGADERVNIFARPVFTNAERGTQNAELNTEDQSAIRNPQSAIDTAHGFILVVFESIEGTASDGSDVAEPSEQLTATSEPLARRLEEELLLTKSQLRHTIEQLELQAEEMRASNEELQALNEELRASSEELETSKEELQSVNEELITVNQELKVKIEEVSQTSNDFQNLIYSTDVATIFLDRSFRVHTFTPAASRIFNLIPADAGRPITDITHRLEHDGLIHDAETVLSSLQTVEREARTLDGRTYLLRVLPYRTAEDRINGVVATFLDITERKLAENFVRESEERLQRAINIETVGVLFFNNDIEITDCNNAFVRMSGYTRGELRAGRLSWEAFTPDGFAEVSNRAIEELNTTGTTTPYEKEYVRKDGSRFWALFAAKRISEKEIVEFVTDITEQKLAEAAVRQSETRLRLALDASEMGTYLWYPQEDRTEMDARNLALFGRREGDTITLADALATIIHPDDRELYAAEAARAIAPGGEGKFDLDFRIVHPDTSLHWLHAYGYTVFEGENPPRAALMYGMVLDIADRKRTEANLAFLAEISQDLERLTNIGETMNVLGEKIAVHLGLSACAFAELDETAAVAVFDYGWHRSDVTSLLGTYRMEEFMTTEVVESCRAGETVIVRDVSGDVRFNGEQYAELNIGSFISFPLVRGGVWRFLLVVYHSEPYNWREDEIELLRELANRIWIRLERARAEAALRETEERLQLSIKGANIFTWAVNPQTGETTYSSNYREVIGFEIAADAQENFLNVPAEERRKVTTAFERAMRGAKPLDVEHRVINPETGEIIWVRAQGQIGNTHDRNTPPVFLGITQNITVRKQAEEAVRESEERLRLATEVGGLGAWEWNIKTDEVFWNERHFILFGMKPRPNPLKSEEFFNHVRADDRERVAAELKRAITEKTVFESDFHAVLETGEERWMSGYGRVVQETDSGEPVKMIGLMFDITERKRAEEALAESETRLRLLIESASDYAIFTTTIDGLIDSWNMGAEKVFGWTETEILGSAAEILFTSADRAAGEAEKEMKTALRLGRVPDERFHVRKDGSRFYASGVMTVLKNDNVVQGFVKIARDMTEQIEAEKAVREKEMLQKLVGAQEDERKRIARDLHDELGQQLTALRLKLDAAKKLCEGDELCGKVDEIELLAKSIDQGVDFLAWELRPAALDHLGLVAALDNYVKQWSNHSGVQAELVTSNLKRARFEPEVETNLYRIVQEALNNTHKHAKAKSAEVVIERRDNLIVVLIEDDGKGFNPASKKNESRGIGLIGMKERAQLIGGTLEIESAPGKGTTVFVRIPAKSVKRKKSDGK